jgi:hypothetical protein
MLNPSYCSTPASSRTAHAPDPDRPSPRRARRRFRPSDGVDPDTRQRAFVRLLHDRRLEALMTGSAGAVR